MSNYPATIKNFLALQDGVDRVLAQHPNERGDEITALQTMLGAIGSTQSYSESFKNMLLKYRRGCRMDFKTAADLYVRAGEIAIPDASGNIRLRRNPSDTTVDWTSLDTGAEANSTTYYVYAVADSSGTTFTVKISLSASLPAGATYYKKLGSFYNNGSGNIATITNDDYDHYGAWVSKSVNTVYQAESDGNVLAEMTGDTASTSLTVGKTDSANTPATVRARMDYRASASEAASFNMTVRKGDFYKVESSTNGTLNIWWIPKGDNV